MPLLMFENKHIIGLYVLEDKIKAHNFWIPYQFEYKIYDIYICRNLETEKGNKSQKNVTHKPIYSLPFYNISKKCLAINKRVLSTLSTILKYRFIIKGLCRCSPRSLHFPTVLIGKFRRLTKDQHCVEQWLVGGKNKGFHPKCGLSGV